MQANFAYEVSLLYPYGSLTCLKILQHGIEGFTSLQRKACCGLLSPLKTHRTWSALNPRTLGPMVNTITTIRLRTTFLPLLKPVTKLFSSYKVFEELSLLHLNRDTLETSVLLCNEYFIFYSEFKAIFSETFMYRRDAL
jgi:hypothetical protein